MTTTKTDGHTPTLIACFAHFDICFMLWVLLGALVLVGGSAADLYGRRRVFVLGIAVFIAASIACGLSPNYEASMVKVFATESSQRMYHFGTRMLGLYGQLTQESKWTRLHGRIEQGYLSSVAPTVYSGSSEIQRNIIATRGLGLPRD